MTKLNKNGNETVWIALLKSQGFFPYSYWYWIGAGALVGYVLLFNVGYTLALMYLNRKLCTFYNYSFIFLIHVSNQFTDMSLYPPTMGKPQAIVQVEGDAIELAESTAEINQNKRKGMVLPFEPHSITFNDIKYSVHMPQVCNPN